MTVGLQEGFLSNEETIQSFRTTISEARFSKYLTACSGYKKQAIQLYHWNALLSQGLYLPLQMWEIALQNKLNDFFRWKYNQGWPTEQRIIRQLKIPDRDRLREAIERQQRARGTTIVGTDSIVADLSAGFWVSLLSNSYHVPFSWNFNLARVFPNLSTAERLEAPGRCRALLDLRNRVAHHEPVFHLPLSERQRDLLELLRGMCRGAEAYVDGARPLSDLLAASPLPNADDGSTATNGAANEQACQPIQTA